MNKLLLITLLALGGAIFAQNAEFSNESRRYDSLYLPQ